MTQTTTYELFISYASADEAWVEGYLMDALDQAGVQYHSEAAFALGVPRLVEFERAIKNSKRTLIILSSAYVADNFMQFTDLLAANYGLETTTWPVIPVMLQGDLDLPTRISQLKALDATASEKWARVVERICEETQKQLKSDEKPACPYPGMVPFKEQDSAAFFGRENEIKELIERLRLQPFLTVIGPSGSGKSSLVFAGLIPALRKSKRFGAGSWMVRTFRPGQSPLEALQTALEADPAEPEQAVANLLASEEGATRLLLVVDQFEETFTVAGEQTLAFQETLRKLSAAPGCYVVLTVRADFYADLMASPLWEIIQKQRFEVIPMGEEGLRQAILLPAERARVFVEGALVERLVRDGAGEPGVLPLIQETLVLLWEGLERRLLPLRAYEALVLPYSAYSAATGGQGARTGLQVAIARRADATLAELTPEQQQIARRILLRLIQFGEGRSDTRRQQRISELRSGDDDPKLFNDTLAHLSNARLLTLSGGERQGGDRRVDISHEALIAGWPTLQGWVAERRDTEKIRRRLEDKADEWCRLGKGAGGLLDEVELAEAVRWIESPDAHDLGYDEALAEMVAASKQLIEAEHARQAEQQRRELEQAQALAEAESKRAQQQELYAKRTKRNSRWFMFSTVVSIGLALAGFYLWNKVQQEILTADSLLLTGNALMLLDTDAQAGLSLIVAAHDQKADNTSVRNGLRRALLATHQSTIVAKLVVQLDGPPDGEQEGAGQSQGQGATGEAPEGSAQPEGKKPEKAIPFRALHWSPDGTRFASASEDGIPRIWDVATMTQTVKLVGHGDWVRDVSWSPDSTRLASASYDQTIRIWDLSDSSRAELRESVVLAGHTQAVYSVDWSPDGSMLASVGRDGSLRIWNTTTGQQLVMVDEGVGESNGVAWSPDGTRVAYSSDDNTKGNIRIWDLAELLDDEGDVFELPVILYGHENYVSNIDWSPDGRWLASAGGDAKIHIWDAILGGDHDTLIGHKLGVNSVYWNADGEHLVSASNDTTIKIWDISSGESETVFTGHQGLVYDAIWSPDEEYIASVSADGSLRMWEVEPPSFTILEDAHPGEVRDLDWSPDERWLASIGSDGALLRWDVTGATSPTQLIKHQVALDDVDWSPDGSRLAVINGQAILSVWSESGVITSSEPASQRFRYQLAWSPDGSQIASTARNEIRIWDSASLKLIRRLSIKDASTLAWSPDGSTLAVAQITGMIGLMDPSSGAVKQQLRGQSQRIWSLDWQPSGERLVTASQDSMAVIWRQQDGSWQREWVLNEHENAINGVEWSPDGSQIATASDDTTTRIWGIGPASQAILSGPTKGLWNATWSPDGRFLAASSVNGTIWIFVTRHEDILAIAREQNLHSYSEEELRPYLKK